MKILTILILLLFTSIRLEADSISQGIATKCIMNNSFELSSLTEWDDTPNDPENSNFEHWTKTFDLENYEITCDLGNNKLIAKYQNRKPSIKGACGLAPGSEVEITINNKIYLQKSLFNNQCFTSFTKISIYFDKTENYLSGITICGKGPIDNPGVDISGCIEYPYIPTLPIKSNHFKLISIKHD